MDDGNVLDDDETVAAAKALRRLLVNGRLGPTEFTLHDCSLLLTIYSNDDHLACCTRLQDDTYGFTRNVCPRENVFSLSSRTVNLSFDDSASEYDILDVFVQYVILTHFFERMNCNDILAVANKRSESSKLSLEHPEAILCWVKPALNGGFRLCGLTLSSAVASERSVCSDKLGGI